ncbi:MAG: HD domain-containing protein [Flavobacteriaceae bacterium]|nr:HD domain-containing protein [Flavobacteriaceae bacterium]
MLKSTKNKDNILKKIKIFNDPIYGFITIENTLIFNIIEHRYFQRLRRISQMGLSYLVYPGANHTRFHHALGCVFLMKKAIETLRMKEVTISKEEEEALYIAILLHDIGHGPFSHALENSIIESVQHEALSLHFMQLLNKEFDGKLNLAIHIFKGEYHRKFMHQLISSQLDMDRLDYLKRDSFYSGVAEGNINAERLITMLNVVNDQLVIEDKGIYSVEKFIVARRLMYWQVYLHKTGLAAENVLVKILKRAKELTKRGEELPASKPLKYFLKSNINPNNLDKAVLDTFSKLDDFDIISAIKNWCDHSDFVLSYLCKAIINRKLPKVKMQIDKFSHESFEDIEQKVKNKFNLTDEEIIYMVFKGEVHNQAYSTEKEQINILYRNGEIKDIANASDNLSIEALSKSVKKYFICYPKNLDY